MNKFKILCSLGIVAALGSCSGGKTAAVDAAEQSAAAEMTASDLEGQWYLENVVENDSVHVRPTEEVPGVRQYILFEDGTYSIQTNCNIISGSYNLKGDSITFGETAATEMACDNMEVEDMLKQILPRIVTVDIENDSIARLNTAGNTSYVLLRKAVEKK